MRYLIAIIACVIIGAPLGDAINESINDSNNQIIVALDH